MAKGNSPAAKRGAGVYRLYHGSPKTDIESLDIGYAGENTSSGERLIFLTDNMAFAEEFSYERLEGSSMVMNKRGKKGRVYEVETTIKSPLDFRNLSASDRANLKKMDVEGLLDDSTIDRLSRKNHQALKAYVHLTPDTLSKYGYDGFIAVADKRTGALEYGVISNSQVKIKK